MTGSRDAVPGELPDPPFRIRSFRHRIQENLPLLVCGAALFVTGVLLLATHSASRIGILPSWSYLFAGGVIMLSGGSMATLYGVDQAPLPISYATADADHILVSRTAWQRLNDLARAQTAVLASAPSRPPASSSPAEPAAAVAPSWLESTEETPSTPEVEESAQDPPSDPTAPAKSSPAAAASHSIQIPPPTPPHRPGAALPRPKPGPIDEELEQLFRELNTQAATGLAEKSATPPSPRPTCRGCGKSVPPTGSRGTCAVCGESFCESCSATSLALTPEGTVCDWCRKLTS